MIYFFLIFFLNDCQKKYYIISNFLKRQREFRINDVIFKYCKTTIIEKLIIIMKKNFQNVDIKINVILKQIEIKFRIIVNTLFFIRSKYI